MVLAGLPLGPRVRRHLRDERRGDARLLLVRYVGVGRPMSALIVIAVWSCSATAALLALAHHINAHLPSEGEQS